MPPTAPTIAPRFAAGAVIHPSHQGEALFQLEGIHKAFGDNVLFEDTSLTVRRGETLSIIGESGCGKSILLKMMIGLVTPDEGKVLFRGDDVTKMDSEGLGRVRRSVGYLFQAGALFDSMTVLDNVAYGIREHKHMPEAAIRERVIECLEKVNLNRRILDQWPAELSGGMRKRVALARAIAVQPEVVLYDEPTQGLDPQSITIIAEMITTLQHDLNITSVLVTHDMRCALSVSDRIAMVHERGIPHVGSPEELAASPVEVVQEFVKEAVEEMKVGARVAEISA